MWFGHVQRMNGSRLPNRAVHCCVDGTRSRSRQPKTWIEYIQEDLLENSLDWRTSLNFGLRQRDMERSRATSLAALSASAKMMEENKEEDLVNKK